MKTIYDYDYKKLSKRAAEIILDEARHLALTKKHVYMALPGGRSVAGIYSEFAKSADKVWDKIHIFLIDERAVPIDHEHSNFNLINESFASTLVKKGLLPRENLHPFMIDDKMPDFGATKYNTLINSMGGRFDIVVLASGEDGHVAGLYPNHKAMEAKENYVYLEDSPKPPAKRITAGPKFIINAYRVFLFFTGDAKKEALAKFWDEQFRVNEVPAKLAAKAKETVIFTDQQPITNSLPSYSHGNNYNW